MVCVISDRFLDRQGVGGENYVVIKTNLCDEVLVCVWPGPHENLLSISMVKPPALAAK